VALFRNWVNDHNKVNGVEKFPIDVTLNYWLKIFAIEARKVSGKPHPPNTFEIFA